MLGGVWQWLPGLAHLLAQSPQCSSAFLLAMSVAGPPLSAPGCHCRCERDCAALPQDQDSAHTAQWRHDADVRRLVHGHYRWVVLLCRVVRMVSVSHMQASLLCFLIMCPAQQGGHISLMAQRAGGTLVRGTATIAIVMLLLLLQLLLSMMRCMRWG